MHPLVEGQEPGEAAEHGALPGPVRPEEGHHLSWLDRQLDIEMESTERPHDVRPQRHAAGAPPPRNRSRKPTSTANETQTSTMLSMTASSGFVSLAR